MRKYDLLILLLVYNAILLFPQQAGYYPDFFNSFSFNPYLVNPSYVPDTGKVDLRFNHKMMAGELRDVSSSLLVATKILKNLNNANAIRLSIGNEQEGQYINVPKFFANYANQIKVAENLKLYSGITLGSTGIYFTAPSASNSFYLPDGSLGVGMKYMNLDIGASSYQIFNNTKYAFFLKRYYQTNTSFLYEIDHQWSIRMIAVSRHFTEVPDEYRLTIYLSYRKHFDCGVTIMDNLSLSFMSSVQIPVSDNGSEVRFLFNYNTNKFTTYKNLPNSLEFGLAVFMP